VRLLGASIDYFLKLCDYSFNKYYCFLNKYNYSVPQSSTSSSSIDYSNNSYDYFLKKICIACLLQLVTEHPVPPALDPPQGIV
jgi:hypothetical protein